MGHDEFTLFLLYYLSFKITDDFFYSFSSCLYEIKYNCISFHYSSTGVTLNPIHLTYLSINILNMYYKARRIKLNLAFQSQTRQIIKLMSMHIPKVISSCKSRGPHVLHLSFTSTLHSFLYSSLSLTSFLGLQWQK